MARRPRSNSARRSRLFRSVDRAMEFKRSRTLRCEPLEERHLLAITWNIIPIAAGTVVGNGVDDIAGNADDEVTIAMPANALAAFNEATRIFDQFLTDDVTVNVEVGWGVNFAATTNAFASSPSVGDSYTNVFNALQGDQTSIDDNTAFANLQPTPDFDMLINLTNNNPNGAGSLTPYLDDDGDANNSNLNIKRANAKAIGLLPANDAAADGRIVFNSTRNWELNRADGLDGFDFTGIAAHEIGHFLGFVSGVDALDFDNQPNGEAGRDDDGFRASVLDLFRFSTQSISTGGIGTVDFTADGRTKFFAVDGGNTPLGEFSEGRNNGTPSDQASHWLESNPEIGIMDPTTSSGELDYLTPIDLAALDVIGWDINATALSTTPTLEGTNADDTFIVRLNPADTTRVQVQLNGVLIATYGVEDIDQLTIAGLGGNDTLIVDSTSGLIGLSTAIVFEGGQGDDSLEMSQTGGDTHTSETVTVGATAGSGISTIIGGGIIQVVRFDDIEPINTNVPVGSFVINGALVGSLLNGANQITYDPSDVFGPSWGRVTIDAFEPVHFINKTDVIVDAENGDDTIVANNSSLPTGLETLTLDGGEGFDDIRLLALPDASATSFVSATALGDSGDDTIDASLIAVDTPLTLTGGSGSDSITGGIGDDTIDAGADDDTVFVSSGNDVVDGGLGADGLVILGTVASDTLIIEQTAANMLATNLNGINGTDEIAGLEALTVSLLAADDSLTVDVDGNELLSLPLFYDGGTGSDLLTVSGTPNTAVQQITYLPGLQPDEGRLTYDQNLAVSGIDMQIDFDNLEPIIDLVPALILDVQGTGAANQITYGPALPGRGLVSIDGFETIAFENKTGLQMSARGGDDTIVINNSDLPTGLESIQANGEDGNDTIRIEALPDASATSFVALAADGAGGNDTIDGSAILVDTPLNLIGGEGNDTLQGGASNDGLVGESGDDTIIDSPGDDIINAGLGNDTFVVRGTFLGELISVIQDAPSLVVADDYTLSVLGPTQGVKQVGKTNLALAPADAANSPTLERIIVEGLAGDDTIRVGHADEYGDLDANNGVPGQTIPYEVVGNGPNASDRLVVPDLGLGDLMIQRQGADQRSGSITVGSLAPVDYSEIEFVNVTPLDPITGGTGTDGAGRLVIFKADPFESNDTRPNATFLGSGPTINIDPTIDPGGIPEFGVPGDNDFYQFVAQETGTLDLQLYFEEIGTLENGRPGLPVNGDLVATVLDSDGVPVSIAMASDLDDPNGIKIGKRVVVPVVRNNTYYLRVEGRAGDQGVTGINVYNFTAITTAAPIPELVDLQADSDSGRNNTDDVTKIETPTFNIILDDDRIDEFMNIDMMPDTVDDDAPTVGFDYGVEVFNNATSIGYAFYTGVGNIWEFTATAGDLNEGDFNHIAAAVWIRDAADPAQLGRHLLSDSLQITLDTMTPPVSFGLPNGVNAEDGLDADSDSGVTTMPMTYADRVTSDTTPNLWGYAEANTIVRLYHDDNGNGIIDLLTDTFLGMTVAVPYDGNLAYPDGYWEIESVLDLNEIVGLPKDGLRQLLVTAEDVAGNPMPMNDQIEDGVDELDIFIDTQGPQVYDPAGATGAVHPTVDPEYDLFDPKPSENGFTPLTNQITIHVRDLPERSNADPNFLYEALKEDIAETLGNYTLVGDHVGHIGIIDVDVINDAPADGQVATATIIITFDQYLPDDRYTLTVSDNLVDPAGNYLDGESNATGPLDDPTFPTGDDVPGGDFVARFTIDSRPEIGTFVPSSITIDINGNFVWDPSNGQIGNDATNVDLTFTMDRPDVAPGGFATHDTVFAGKFVGGGFGGGGMVADRYFDQLAVYGYSVETAEHRWLIDLDSDGVADVYSAQPLLANFNVAGALPIAGNFDDNLANGDEIGLYYAGNWAFDFNHNFVIEAGEVVANTGLLGIPIVGDFDGNGIDDVGVFNNNIFNFAFSIGAFGAFGAFDSLQWGFSGVLERPVAADMDQDGVDDIGLFVPRNSSQPLRETAEWYFLLSDAFNTVLQEGTLSLLDHAFEPVPFGADLYAEFGDELSLPVVGNFDPPVAAQTSPNEQNVDDLPGDYDGSGTVDRSDYEVWKANFGLSGSGIAGDGNNDGNVDLADFTVWRNHLGQSLPTNTVASNNLPGDFDGNGTVDTGDYSLWKESFGQVGTGLAADGNGDGQVDLADFTVWRNHLGTSQPVAALAALSTTTEIVSAASSGTTTTDVATPKSDTTAEAKALALEGLVDDEKPSEGPTPYSADAGFGDGDDLLLLRTSREEQESEWPEEAMDEAIQSHSNELFGLAIDWGW